MMLNGETIQAGDITLNKDSFRIQTGIITLNKLSCGLQTDDFQSTIARNDNKKINANFKKGGGNGYRKCVLSIYICRVTPKAFGTL